MTEVKHKHTIVIEPADSPGYEIVRCTSCGISKRRVAEPKTEASEAKP